MPNIGDEAPARATSVGHAWARRYAPKRPSRCCYRSRGGSWNSRNTGARLDLGEVPIKNPESEFRRHLAFTVSA